MLFLDPHPQTVRVGVWRTLPKYSEYMLRSVANDHKSCMKTRIGRALERSNSFCRSKPKQWSTNTHRSSAKTLIICCDSDSGFERWMISDLASISNPGIIVDVCKSEWAMICFLFLIMDGTIPVCTLLSLFVKTIIVPYIKSIQSEPVTDHSELMPSCRTLDLGSSNNEAA